MGLAGLLLLATSSLPSAPPSRAAWALLDDPGPSACAELAPVGARLERTPGLVLTRTASLAETRARLEGTAEAEVYGVSVRPAEGGFRAEVRGPMGVGRGLASSPQAALAAAWPGEAPRLAPEVVFGSPAALAAACRGDAETTRREAGAALTPLLAELVDLPEASRTGSVFERWAHAAREARAGRPERAAPVLRTVVRDLERGAWGPAWRRGAQTATAAASALTAGDGDLFVFAGGTFIALDPATGVKRWSHHVGRAEPRPVFVRPDLILLLGETKTLAVDPRSGANRFTLPRGGLFPEIVLRGPNLYLAHPEGLLAVALEDGRVLWERPFAGPLDAGPVDVGFALALPKRTQIVLVDPASGRPLPALELGDEISAPLLVTPARDLWVWVGSDELRELDPRRRSARVRIQGLGGARWPPVALGERLAVLTRSGRRDDLVWVDPVAPDGRRFVTPASGPVIRRSDFSGVLHLDPSGRRLIERRPSGDVRLRLDLGGPAVALATLGARVVAGVRDVVRVVDVERERVLHDVEVGGETRALVLGPGGGATLLADGSVLGWPPPGDPRAQAWLQKARRDLARAALEAGLAREALTAAESALARAPDDLGALALAARAGFAVDPERGAARLVELADRLPKGYPERRSALERLATLGLEPASAEGPLPRPEPVALPGLEASGETLSAFAPGTGEPRWQARFRGETVLDVDATAEALFVWTSARLYRLDPATGQTRGRLLLTGPPRRRVVAGARAAVLDGDRLRVIDLEGPRFVADLALPGPARLGVDGAAILVELESGRRWRFDPAPLAD